ncbi:hypothetical protein Tco_0843308 [Tanacetum coccineum]|uniref:Xylulose kinase-1 n=1 Tax=Tanacetum coccineum TaxID=301880 RepID=A0ABQ5B2L8_9ASTR
MADLAFVKQHNMVAYHEKTEENTDFHQILDFLTSSSINFALIVSPTIYASYIEQFWNTACLKTINLEKQIHANVDGKVVVVSESSVRRDLHLNDEDGTACLTTNEIFENLALMGYEPTFDKCESLIVGDEAINEEMLDSVERAATTATSLEAEQASGNIHKTQFMATLNEPFSLELGSGSGPWRQETIGGMQAQTRSEGVSNLSSDPPLSGGHTLGSGEDSMEHQIELTDNVPNTPHDSPLPGVNTPGSDEGRLKLEELMAMCTKLSKQVLDLEKEKDAQAVEILKLKKRVKKLERQRKSSISHPRRRIYRQVESSDDDLDEEDASKQGRKSDKTKPMFKDSDFDGLDDDMENVEGETVYAATSGVLYDRNIGILDDDMVTMADTLIAIRQTRTRPSYLPRPTSVVITDTEQEQRRLTTPPPSQPSDTRDKGKGIMVEPDPPVKIKRSDQGDLQLQADAELAQLLHQEELAQVERRQRERAAQEEASIAALYEEYDTIQASIDVDALFAARLQQEERESKIRSKPPTKTQLRNMMITYLKNMGKFNHNQLKGKSYEELQRLYEREQKWINDFVPMDSEKEEKKSVEPESEGKKGKRIKRVTDSALKQKSSKKQKMMQRHKELFQRVMEERSSRL